MTMFLSRGFACTITGCYKFATHEESYDGGNTWHMRCEKHRAVVKSNSENEIQV